MRPVIVLSGGPTLQPLYPVLARDYDLCIQVKGLADQARGSGLPAFALEETASSQDLERAEAIARNAAAFKGGLITLDMDAGHVGSKLVDILGEDCRRVADSVKDWLPGKAMVSCMGQIWQTLLLDKLKTERNVRAVIVANDILEGMASLVAWAQARSVPSMHVPHAVYIDAWRARRDIHDWVKSDYLAVAGPFQQEWYLRRGAKPDRIRQTGLPQWDCWASFERDPNWARALFRLEKDRPVICYCSSWDQATSLVGLSVGSKTEQGYQAFLGTVDPGWQVIVKLHPASNKNAETWHAERAKEANVVAIITRAYLPECLAASDLVLSIGPSNILIDAALAGVPRLAAIEGFNDDSEIGTCEATPEAIKQTLTKLLANEPATLTGFIAKYAGTVDGKATERIAAWVNELDTPKS